MNTLVSIVIPVYNTEQFIERCLKSVFEQTLKEFEIIIVDDCSPDNAIHKAEKLLKLYPNRVKYTKIIRLKENVGLASARKVAFEKCNGVYITCVDSDDFLELNALEKMLNKIQETQADMVVCDFYETYPNGENIIKQTTTNKTYLSDLFRTKLHGAYWNKLYKREILAKVKILNGVNMCEDFLFAVQMGYLTKKIVYLNKAFTHYIQYNPNSYTANYSDKSIQDILTVVDFVDDFLKKYKIYDEYEIDFAYRKLFFKFMILSNTSSEKRASFFSIFEETDKYIKLLPLYYRIILIASKLKSNILINLILYVKNIVKSFRHKLNYFKD